MQDLRLTNRLSLGRKSNRYFSGLNRSEPITTNFFFHFIGLKSVSPFNSVNIDNYVCGLELLLFIRCLSGQVKSFLMRCFIMLTFTLALKSPFLRAQVFFLFVKLDIPTPKNLLCYATNLIVQTFFNLSFVWIPTNFQACAVYVWTVWIVCYIKSFLINFWKVYMFFILHIQVMVTRGFWSNRLFPIVASKQRSKPLA